MTGVEPRNIDKSTIEAVSFWVEGLLREQLVQNSKPIEITNEIRKGVTKRLSPKNAMEYVVAEKLPTLIRFEIETLASRIRLYHYTAQYRNFITFDSHDMFAAWQLHSHSLRQNELYIIQERGSALLTFLRQVAGCFGLKSTDRSKNFAKKMKMRFEYRLRERHRIVHVHERPSMSSLLIDFTMFLEENDKETAMAVYGDVLDLAQRNLFGKHADDPEEWARRMLAVEEEYINDAKNEAIEVFDILTAELGATLGASFSCRPSE